MDLKIAPLVGAVGKFTFSTKTGFSICDSIDQAIIGSAVKKLTHPQVAQLVASVDRQKFIDVSLGRPDRSNTSSAIIRLKNGNVVKDTYRYFYHQDDYFQRSLLAIKGTTQLIGKCSN